MDVSRRVYAPAVNFTSLHSLAASPSVAVRNCSTEKPSGTIDNSCISYSCPNQGSTKAVDSNPAPPMRDKPIGPVFGKFSETKPIIVGQKKDRKSTRLNSSHVR